MVRTDSVSNNPFAQSAHYQQLTLISGIESVPMVEMALEELVFSMAHFEHEAENLVVRSSQVKSDYAEHYEGRLESVADLWRTDAVVGDAESKAEVETRLLLLQQSGARLLEWQWNPLEMKDWVSEIQSQFPPLSVGRFYIHGSHLPPKSHPAISIKMDAGCAFGTGEHGTTAGCLRALELLARTGRPQKILDLGCGTGILAIAAQKLWPEARIVGSDMDAVAVQVAARNARQNTVPQIKCYTAAGFKHPALQQQYDLVIANILARPLIFLARDVVHHLKPGGTAILSGLLNTQEKEVQMAYHARGMRWQRSFRQDSWVAMIMRKQG